MLRFGRIASLGALSWLCACGLLAGLDDFGDAAGNANGGASATASGGANGTTTGSGGATASSGGTGGSSAAGGNASSCDPQICSGNVDDCNTQACVGDVCSAAPVAEGTMCTYFFGSIPGGTPGVCDDAGNCGACNSPSDCPNAASDLCIGNQCVPGTCNDGQQTGGETDIDCGGPCPACGIGDSCTVGDDCTTGWCTGAPNATCSVSATCATLRAAVLADNGTAPDDGVYFIDPDGGNASNGFQAYCDMSGDGGGWTLVMKLTSGNTFAYSVPLWTNTDTLAPTDLVPNMAAPGKDAKLAAYNAVAGSTLRLQWLEPAGMSWTHSFNDNRTAQAHFSGGSDLIAGDLSDACHGPLLSGEANFDPMAMSHGEGHQAYGFNITPSGNGRMRWGFGSDNNSTTPHKPWQAIGAENSSLNWSGQAECTECDCYGSRVVHDTTAANLWIR